MVSREIYEVEAQKGALGFAVVKDAVVATINVANPHFDDVCKKGLTKATAAALWNNQYATYGDLLGIESTIPVHVYTRSDACGAAETWAIWFGKRQEQLQGTAVYGDPGVSAAVQKDRVGIGYNNIAYAYDMRTHKPYEGLAVIPLDINENGQIDEDEKFYGNSADLKNSIPNVADGFIAVTTTHIQGQGSPVGHAYPYRIIAVVAYRHRNRAIFQKPPYLIGTFPMGTAFGIGMETPQRRIRIPAVYRRNTFRNGAGC